MRPKSPTQTTYDALVVAYQFLNDRMFGGSLPNCLITLQRKSNTYGYFAGDRFSLRDGHEVTDEIALNPSHFKERTIRQILSTLLHEMVHLQQHHGGKPSRSGYHNKEWARMMRMVGLIPSNTGIVGGMETGQSVSHYVEVGGPFDRVYQDLIDLGFTLPYIEKSQWTKVGIDVDIQVQGKKAASKSRYSCPNCGINVWGKPNLNIVCGHHNLQMLLYGRHSE
jgi:hypothetical protein